MHPFAALNVGDKAKILGFLPHTKSYRLKLLAMGLTPGTVLTILRKAPLGDPIKVRIRGYDLSLRKKEMTAVLLEKL